MNPASKEKQTTGVCRRYLHRELTGQAGSTHTLPTVTHSTTGRQASLPRHLHTARNTWIIHFRHTSKAPPAGTKHANTHIAEDCHHHLFTRPHQVPPHSSSPPPLPGRVSPLLFVTGVVQTPLKSRELSNMAFIRRNISALLQVESAGAFGLSQQSFMLLTRSSFW